MSTRHVYGVHELSDGTWQFGCDVDGQQYPAGYCVPWEELTSEIITERFGLYYVPTMLKVQAKKRPFRRKYHEHKHKTKAEACECFHEFIMDQGTIFHFIDAEIAGKSCEIPDCSDPPTVEAELYPINVFFYMCQQHSTKEDVAVLFTPEDVCSKRFTLIF